MIRLGPLSVRRWRSGTRCRHPQPRRGERPIREFGDFSILMTELDTTTTGSVTTLREKRDAQKAQLRPLANRRPELYDEDEYTSADYERMMELVQRDAGLDRGRRDRQEQGARDPRQPRRARHRLQVRRQRSARRVQGLPRPQAGRRSRGPARAPRGPGRLGRPVQEEGRLHARVGDASASPTRPTSRSKARSSRRSRAAWSST